MTTPSVGRSRSDKKERLSFSEQPHLCRFAILTRTANASMEPVHNRMPVIVSAGDVRPYLTDDDAARGMIAAAGPELVRRAV